MNTTAFVNKLLTDMEFMTDKHNNYFIPITKVDGICVDVIVRVFKTRLIHFLIETKEPFNLVEDDHEPINLYRFIEPMFCDFSENKRELNFENLKIVVDKMFSDLEDLKFDKMKSYFVKERECGMFDFVRSLKNVKVGEDCCVCLEPTSNTTICDHHICIPCMTQLKRKPDEKYGDHTITCPMCSEYLS